MKAQYLDSNEKPAIAFLDDDKDLTDAYTAIFSQFYQVVVFNNSEEFLKYLDFHESSPFDVLVTDLRMPVLGGLDVVREARNRGFEFSALLLSSFLGKEEVVAAVNGGFSKVVDKSSDVVVVLMAVEELVIENRLRKNQTQIREMVLKLRESYQHVQLLLSDFLEDHKIDAAAKNQIDTIEELLTSLESRLDGLLEEGQALRKLRQRFTKAA